MVWRITTPLLRRRTRRIATWWWRIRSCETGEAGRRKWEAAWQGRRQDAEAATGRAILGRTKEWCGTEANIPEAWNHALLPA